MAVNATVAICTWNRAPLLERTLQSIVESPPEQGVSWELLVVNNRCTDDTDAVLAKYRDVLPLRRLYEERQGKSHALNLALREARGDLILWTDDDVLLNAGAWIGEHLAAAKRYPAADFFGGPVIPIFDAPPPDWLVRGIEKVLPAFAGIDLGGDCRPITDVKDAPFGANFAIRTEVQRAYLYDSRFGRVGPNDIRGEETILVRHMLEEGRQGQWLPSAIVQHIIPPERMTLDYIRRWYQGIGRTHAIMCLAGLGKTSPLWRAWARAMVREISYRVNQQCRPPRVWLHHMARASRRWGEFEQLREESQRRAA